MVPGYVPSVKPRLPSLPQSCKACHVHGCECMFSHRPLPGSWEQLSGFWGQARFMALGEIFRPETVWLC